MHKPTPRSSPLTRLGRAIERAATVLFARSDARARATGWEVRSTGRWNASRVYHDPRYDRLAACPSCAGHGCPRCSGTGRITRTGPDRAAGDATGGSRCSGTGRITRTGPGRAATGVGRAARDPAGPDPGGGPAGSERVRSRR